MVSKVVMTNVLKEVVVTVAVLVTVTGEMAVAVDSLVTEYSTVSSWVKVKFIVVLTNVLL